MNKKRKAAARKQWIKVYHQLGSVSKAAKRCGIARSTLHRWIDRYNKEGIDGLDDKSQKPNKLAKQKVDGNLEKLILEIRKKHSFGPQRISTYLLRESKIKLSPPTIWRVLNKNNVKQLKKYSPRKTKKYNRPVPGDRVQMDVTKIRQKCYQFTAIDDCTRMKVMRLYTSKQAENTVLFLFEVINNFPFPIQRVQTDWGTEFFNYLFQEELMVHFIKFRPIKPRSPHLNGKVERSQKTDKMEFYSLLNLKDKELKIEPLLAEWEHFYNYQRPHSSLLGKTPYEKYLELENIVPHQTDVSENYWKSNEKILPRNSQFLKFIKLKTKRKNNLICEPCG